VRSLPPLDEPVPVSGELLFIGTATVLIRCFGFTILTDPNFLHQGEHAKLGYGLRSRRLTEPAMTIDELPPIDLVVLSHHHGDHFDEVAAAELDREVPIVTTRHAARKLRRQGFREPIALETWDSVEFTRDNASLKITSMPGRHAPLPLQALMPPVMGSLLQFGLDGDTRFRTYVTGDTLHVDELAAIPSRYPDIDLMVLHLGGTRIAGVLLTMDAEQGVRTLRLVRPRHAIPIHFNDYTVFKSPISDFRSAVQSESSATKVHFLDRGETFSFPIQAGPSASSR
jgi:L-ascorbate metabolism protein UlaG (beta-lactamase superfamily)